MSVPIKRRRLLQTLAVASAALAAPSVVRAQDVDSLKILVGFPAGGVLDAVCRILADKIAPSYAKNAIVENRPGADTALGAVQVARSFDPIDFVGAVAGR